MPSAPSTGLSHKPPDAPWPQPITHIFVVPIDGQRAQARGYMLCGLSPRLPFDAPYREYLQSIGRHLAHSRERTETILLRAALEQERNSLLEQAPVATALLTGPQHVFQLANAAYLHMVGRKNIVGQPVLEAFPEIAGSDVIRALDMVYQTGEPFVTNEMHVPLANADESTLDDRYFKFSLNPVRDTSGEVYGIIAAATDISEQVMARKQLEQAHAAQEKLLAQLESASRAKDEFLAMLGHELRNPLSPILTAVELMRMRNVQGADREREIIERQARHVVGLVDDLLDISRITRGMLELKWLHSAMMEVVAKAIEQASPLMEQRQHRLHIDVADSLTVHGDTNRLAQVVANLLTNAAKYTEPEGDIWITGEQQGQHVVLRVRDNGIGIEPERLPTVFDVFSRAPSPTAGHGSLGLGLAIVKSLVEAHGGSVSINSAGRGRGTECVVRLPSTRVVSAPETKSIKKHTQPLASGCHVLLVDDNEDAADLLCASLQDLGHEVQVAYDASKALELADTYVPDVALLDLGLPVIDGYELAARLKSKEGWTQVRFAALTGYGQQHDKERTAKAGFSAHLTKPTAVRDVDSTLRHLTGRDRRMEGKPQER